MTVEIIIDPNVRIEGKRTYAGFEDVIGGFVNDLHPGDAVTVVEDESDYVGAAIIYGIDAAKELIFLTVDWSSLQPRETSETAGGMSGYTRFTPLVKTTYLTPSLGQEVAVTAAAGELAYAG